MATPKQTESKERLVAGQHLPEEDSYELKLRPRLLKEFVGQSKVKENLKVAIEAAKSRGEALDHYIRSESRHHSLARRAAEPPGEGSIVQ